MNNIKAGDRARLADPHLVKRFKLAAAVGTVTVEEPLPEQPSAVMIICYARNYTVQFDDGEVREGVYEWALERESD